MPMHDWTRVEAGVYHDFHQTWITHLKEALNGGVLPPPYYARLEQVAVRPTTERFISDASALGSWPSDDDPAMAPRVREKWVKLFRGDLSAYRQKKSVVAIREATADGVVAMIEFVSPGDKCDEAAFHDFIDRLAALLTRGVHLLVLDSFPPTPRDPQGFDASLGCYLYKTMSLMPVGDQTRTAASYFVIDKVYTFDKSLSVGDALPDMPLLLSPDISVTVPLEATYAAAWRSVPQRWQRVIVGN